jgi:hypothetical protein
MPKIMFCRILRPDISCLVRPAGSAGVQIWGESKNAQKRPSACSCHGRCRSDGGFGREGQGSGRPELVTTGLMQPYYAWQNVRAPQPAKKK